MAKADSTAWHGGKGINKDKTRAWNSKLAQNNSFQIYKMVQLNNLWAVLAIATTSFSGVTARAVVARQDDKVEVKILPLGASIMSGVGSEKHSG